MAGKDYKIFKVKGEEMLSHCLEQEENEGYELMDIKWAGNVQMKTPAAIVAPLGGEAANLNILTLYLVIFVRPHKPSKKTN
jgi:hypothetical protein